MILLQVISLILWLAVLPYVLGLLPCRWLDLTYRTPGVILLFGYIVMFALFELIAVPVVMVTVYNGLTVLRGWVTGISVFFVAAAVLMRFRMQRKGELFYAASSGSLKKRISDRLHMGYPGKEERIVWLLFLLLFGFQLYMAFTRASFDGDDAYYVVHSLTAQEQDVLYRIEPDTGKSTPLDMRHALAVFPLWIAHIAKGSGIHATVIAHSIVPLVMLPLTYLLYFQIGSLLLKKKRDMLPMFMVIMALYQMFGNVSIYTNETFLMTRTWQGKSFAGNFVIPALLWLFLLLTDRMEQNRQTANPPSVNRESSPAITHQTGTGIFWVLLGIVNWTAGFGSSQAALLCAMLTGLFGLLIMLYYKDFRLLVKAGLACIPNAVYILLYVFMTR